MHYPEFDVLCHEVAGKLAELRRLTMETVILTDDQEALLAELTRLPGARRFLSRTGFASARAPVST